MGNKHQLLRPGDHHGNVQEDGGEYEENYDDVDDDDDDDDDNDDDDNDIVGGSFAKWFLSKAWHHINY